VMINAYLPPTVFYFRPSNEVRSRGDAVCFATILWSMIVFFKETAADV
jgi:hypothetical protein